MNSLIRQKISGLPSYLKTWVKTFSGGLTVFCLFDLIVFPFISQNPAFLNTILRQMSLAMIFSILAASWDFLAGIAGQVSFGHAIFFGIGGYICAYLISYQYFPMWLSIIIGGIGAVIFGLIIGIPCLRLKGPYLALGTLSFSLILLKLFNMGSLKDFFFGSEGIAGLPRLSNNPRIEYFVIFISLVAIFIILIAIGKSKFGTVLKSIRDDETSSEASGINVTKYKIYAYMISALFAGFAGTFYALFTTAVNPTGNFGTLISFYAIIMASLGGITTIAGSAIGAFFFVLLEYILIQLGFELYVFLIFAIILIIVIRFAEHGILKPALEHLKDFWDILLGR
jgi:branched-chain amino acid transport system permease protein